MPEQSTSSRRVGRHEAPGSRRKWPAVLAVGALTLGIACGGTAFFAGRKPSGSPEDGALLVPPAASASASPRPTIANIEDICSIYPNAKVKVDFGLEPRTPTNHNDVVGEAGHCIIPIGKQEVQIDVHCNPDSAKARWEDLLVGYGKVVLGTNDGARVAKLPDDDVWYGGAKAETQDGGLCLIEANVPYTMPGKNARQMEQVTINVLSHVYGPAVAHHNLRVPEGEPALLALTR